MKKYKVVFVHTVNDGKLNPRFKLVLRLPFIPSKDIKISRKDSVIIPLHPINKVIYNYEAGNFVCHLSYTPVHILDSIEWDQLYKNFKDEGWERID